MPSFLKRSLILAFIIPSHSHFPPSLWFLICQFLLYPTLKSRSFQSSVLGLLSFSFYFVPGWSFSLCHLYTDSTDSVLLALMSILCSYSPSPLILVSKSIPVLIPALSVFLIYLQAFSPGCSSQNPGRSPWFFLLSVFWVIANSLWHTFTLGISLLHYPGIPFTSLMLDLFLDPSSSPLHCSGSCPLPVASLENDT